MTHVVLVGPEFEENLSIRYISGALQHAGHTTELVPFNDGADFGWVLEEVLAHQPGLVGISLAFQWRASDFLALAIALRQRGYRGHITGGGHFATFEAANLLRDFPEVDSIVRQEAEDTMVTLATALSTSSRPRLEAIAGLALRTSDASVVLTEHAALPNLAALPWPDRRGEPARCFGHAIAPLVSSRGCYANCTFCCIAAWHEQSLPGKRYRIRDVEDVADEMLDLKKTRGVEIFVFHDDNFFVPGHKRNFERFSALADALERRNIGAFATVVKARPTDADPAVFRVLRERLHCIRTYIGIETDADQGLATLRRWSPAKQNRKAIELVKSLDLYTCFNVLLFDPDTTLDSIDINVEFMRYAAEFPFNFGRVELYAGTPLLDRMLREGRTYGDYMQWDYDLGNPEVELAFGLAMECFMARNFGDGALANQIMGTRFDVEVVKHFHPDLYRSEWSAEAKRLSSVLAESTADGLARIVRFVREQGPGAGHEARSRFTVALAEELRACEREVTRGARDLARTLGSAVGRSDSLTTFGDRVATSLQGARGADGAFVVA